MANVPEGLTYTTSHEWVSEQDGTYTIGLTDFAQDALGDLVFVNLPQEGDHVTAGETLCDVESVKAVSDVFSPVTGTVSEVNEALADSPEMINETPYEAWIARIEGVSEVEELLDAAAYVTFCKEA
jgi:glycine cleavage system H protein